MTDKIGWLLNLVSKSQIDSELQKTLLRITELRNQIVHYKAVPSKIIDGDGGSYGAIRREIEKLNFDEVFEILDWLAEALDEALLHLRSNIDDYKLTQEAMRTLKNQ